MTRKLTLIILLGCVFVASAYSQKDQKFKPYWQVGVGFGPTFSSVDFAESGGGTTNAIETKNMFQMHGGVAVRYMSENHLGFIAELNYSQQGWEQNFDKDELIKPLGLAHSRKLSYIEVPFLTHIYFGNKLRFIVNLGPKVAYMISEKEEINDALINYLSSGNASGKFVSHQYFRDIDKKLDYGILGGLGLEFNSKIGSFSLEGRYYYGLADIYNNSKSDHFARSANRIISARLTYYVKLF